MANINKTEYPALLATLEPGQAVSVLNSRIEQIHGINTEIASWLSERRRIEEQYVQALNSLAAKKSVIRSQLGVFQTPWHGIVAGVIAIAEAHGNLALRIETDVESPLKDQRRDLQSMNSLQANLAALAKDVEKNRKKASTGPGSAASSWESQAPYIFEQLQSLDESRVNQMREALTQLQTHEIDCHERSKSSAEQSLNALLNVDTPEEVSAFVARVSSETPPSGPIGEPDRPGTSSRRGTASRPGDDSALAPTRTGRRDTDDGRSEISEFSNELPKTEKKSRFGGLRRLGTVMSRRKEKDKDSDLGKSPDKRSARRNPLRRNSSARMEPIPSPNPSVPDLTAGTTPQQEDSRAIAPEASGVARSDEVSEVAPSGTSAVETSTFPTTNGTLAATNIPQIGIRPPSTIVEEGAAGSVLADIERAQQEANNQDHENQFNVSIRDRPIQEESSDANAAAVANVSNALRASQLPPPQRRSGTVRGRRDVRNTMFVPSTSSDFTSTNEGTLPPSSPAFGSISSPVVPTELRGADAQSIRSAHSMASSTGPGLVKHADMTSPGLNVSIVETSSATFSGGALTKAVVIGELAMLHNGTAHSTAPVPIRLDNFQVLEKVAPNPALVNQLPDRTGEYNVDISQLSRTSVGFKYQIHLNDTALANYAPIVITPQYKIEATQTSVILAYNLNPLFAANVAPPLKLNNLVVILNLEGARATSCQSKPTGIFSKEKRLIYWKLGDVTLDANPAVQQKLLARFATEGEASQGTIEARWELSGAGSGLGVSLLGDTPSSATADPFADAGASSTSVANVREIDVHRRLISGRYIAS